MPACTCTSRIHAWQPCWHKLDHSVHLFPFAHSKVRACLPLVSRLNELSFSASDKSCTSCRRHAFNWNSSFAMDWTDRRDILSVSDAKLLEEKHACVSLVDLLGYEWVCQRWQMAMLSDVRSSCAKHKCCRPLKCYRGTLQILYITPRYQCHVSASNRTTSRWNDYCEVFALSDEGRAFQAHAAGAATGKAWSPSVEHDQRRCWSRPETPTNFYIIDFWNVGIVHVGIMLVKSCHSQ